MMTEQHVRVKSFGPYPLYGYHQLPSDMNQWLEHIEAARIRDIKVTALLGGDYVLYNVLYLADHSEIKGGN